MTAAVFTETLKNLQLLMRLAYFQKPKLDCGLNCSHENFKGD
jgi:hypothetical protein